MMKLMDPKTILMMSLMDPQTIIMMSLGLVSVKKVAELVSPAILPNSRPQELVQVRKEM